MPADFDYLYPPVSLTTVALLLVLERVRALRRQPVAIAARWTSNIGLYLIGSVVASIVLPIGIYAFARERPPGWVASLEWPFVAKVALTFLLLDLWKYWEHRAYHGVALLWRLHLVHHSDTAVDVTTTERHHPLEIVAGVLTMVGVVAALGLTAPALAIYLLTASVIALCSHANLRLPLALDRALRTVVVTPSVHATHHSDLRAETDSSFGAVLSIWDRLFGTWVNPEIARIPHFGLDYFHRLPDTRLGRVLQQPFLFRRGFAYPARQAEPAKLSVASRARPFAGFATTPRARAALFAGAVGCALVVLTMGSAAVPMVATWRNSEAYQYAWLVLPMLAYILGWHWDLGRQPVDVRPDFTGVVVVVAAAACDVVATLMNVDVGRQFALILALEGVAMSTLGWRSYWRLFPALALLFLMIPAGDVLLPPLRELTVRALDAFAMLAGLPHRVEGYVVFIGARRYIVIDECAGLAYVTLASFLGYSFGLLLYRSFAKVAAMALLGAALGILSNVLRVCSIVLIDWLRGSQMDLAAHGTLQWIGLLVSLGLLFCVLYALDADTATGAPATPALPAAIRSRRLAPIVAGMAGLLVAGGAASLQTSDARFASHAPAPLSLPEIPGWVRSGAAPAWSLDPDGRFASARIAYDRHGRVVEVIIVETLSPKAKLPESQLAPTDGGVWREHRAERDRGCADGVCFAFRHSIWRREMGHEARHVYLAYGLGGYSTDSRFALRAMHGWLQLTGRNDAPRLIGFVTGGDALDANELAGAYRTIETSLDAASLQG